MVRLGLVIPMPPEMSIWIGAKYERDAVRRLATEHSKKQRSLHSSVRSNCFKRLLPILRGGV
jgi:hypothetical protein